MHPESDPEGNPDNKDRIDMKSVAHAFELSILAARMFLERWTGATRSDLVLKQRKLSNSFIFGMLY